jgi:hypothetical protein
LLADARRDCARSAQVFAAGSGFYPPARVKATFRKNAIQRNFCPFAGKLWPFFINFNSFPDDTFRLKIRVI